MKRLRRALHSEPAKAPLFIALFIGPWVSIGAGVVIGGADAAISGMVGAAAIILVCVGLGMYADWDSRPGRPRTEATPITGPATMLALGIFMAGVTLIQRGGWDTYVVPAAITAFGAAAITPWGRWHL